MNNINNLPQFTFTHSEILHKYILLINLEQNNISQKKSFLSFSKSTNTTYRI